MPRFGKTSLRRLEECHPLLQALFSEVIKYFDCSVLCGHRPMDEQNKMFEEGKSRLQWPFSTHNQIPSMAVDVVPYYLDKPHIRWDRRSLYRYYYFAGVVKGLSIKLGIVIRWGGDWDSDTYVRDQKFNDLPHFELTMEG